MHETEQFLTIDQIKVKEKTEKSRIRYIRFHLDPSIPDGRIQLDCDK